MLKRSTSPVVTVTLKLNITRLIPPEIKGFLYANPLEITDIYLNKGTWTLTPLKETTVEPASSLKRTKIMVWQLLL